MIRRGHLKDCEQIYNSVLAVRRTQNDRRGEAKTWNDLGVCKQFKEEWDAAIDHYRQSIKLQEQLLKENSEDSQYSGIDQLPKTYNSLGFAFQAKGEFDEAEKAYQQALKICQEATSKQLPTETDLEITLELSQTYNNLAWLRTCSIKRDPDKLREQFEKARKEFEQTIKIKLKHPDPRLGQTRRRYGELYLLNNQGRMAQAEFDKALNDLQEINDKYELGLCYKGLGSAAQQQGDWKKAEEAFLNSLQFLREEDYPFLNGEVHIELGIVYKKREPEKALAEVKKALSVLEPTDEENLKRKAQKLAEEIEQLIDSQ